jgi:hypothetical protein
MLRFRTTPRTLSRPPCQGQSLVEFALLLPVFVLFFAATLDLGRLFYAQITLTNAAREGAFQAAQTPESYQGGQPCDPATNLVVCRVALESRNSFVNVDPADIQMSCSPAGCPEQLGSVATVEVSGEFTLVTPILAPFFGGSQTIDLRARATAQREYVPPAPPSFSFISPPPSPSPSPSPTPTGSPGASPSGSPAPPTECVVPNDGRPGGGEPGVHPPNVIGVDPGTAEARIAAKGLVPHPEGDLRTGQPNVVREQSPDASECVPSGSEVRFKYRA